MASINFKPYNANSRLAEARRVDAKVSGLGVGDYVRKAVCVAQVNGEHDDEATYAGGFELGGSVAGIAVRRLIEEGDPSILAEVVEQVLGFSLPTETPEGSARRAVFCGLLFEIGAVLEAAGNRLTFSGGGDEEIFDQGLRDGRDAAAAALTEARTNAATA